MTCGTLAILNCTTGDTRISFDSNSPEEVERAKAVVEDMLKRGYCIAVIVGGRMERAVGFDPKTNEYIVQDRGEPLKKEGDGVHLNDPKMKSRGRRASTTRKVKASDTSAISVGPTAGGGLCGHAFGLRSEGATHAAAIVPTPFERTQG